MATGPAAEGDKGARIYDANCCAPCSLFMHFLAVSVLCFIPCCCSFLTPRPLLVSSAVVISVTLPRLLWREHMAAEGTTFTILMGLYWNVAYVICFASPLLVIVACFALPKVVLPLLGLYIIATRVIFRPDLKDGAEWPVWSQSEWGYHASRRYLRLRLHIDPELQERPPEKQVVIGVHPHGIASDFRIVMDGMMYEALPKRSVLSLAASVLFMLPLVREICLWTRCIDASKSVATRAMKKGHSILVVPGGEREQIETTRGNEEVFLLQRMGFVKLALQAGAALVPSYVFGCVDLYETSNLFYAAREKLRKNFSCCIPIYWGSILFLPKRVPLNLIIGAPLEVSCAKPGEPTDAEVAAAHALYIEALQKLFDENKARFGYEDRKLKVK